MPFMTEPLLSDFGYLANKKVSQEVFDGTYIPPPNLPKYILEYLDMLVMPEAMRKLGPTVLSISHQDNSTGWP